MSLTQNKIIHFLFAAILTLGLAVPLQAQILVLRSGGPPTFEKKYPQGTKLDETSTITLPEHGWIKILRKSGLETLHGPGAFAFGEHRSEKISGLSTAERLQQFINNRRQQELVNNPQRTRGEPTPQQYEDRERRLGSREQTLSNQSPSLWYIDLRYSRVCVPTGQSVNLWRWESTNAQTLEIREMGGENLKEVSFPSDVPLQPWPESENLFSRTQSKIYEIFQENQDRKVISVIPIEANDQNDAIEIAEQLIENKCKEQLVLLERALE